MRCFYCDTLQENRILLSPQEERHIFLVNKLKTDEKLLFIDGKGRTAEARITKNNSFEILNMTAKPEPSVKLHLFIAPPRRQQMDQIIEQSSEIGIWSITPIITERAVAIPEKSSDNQRWRMKLIESCKQSRNPFLPEIKPPLSLKDAASDVKKLQYQAFYGSLEKTQNSELLKKTSDIAWFVGPEGGFAQKEIEYMRNEGIKPLMLGSFVMRVETAAIVGGAFLINSLIENL